jgi:cytochrome c-type biogenesis protein CcmH
VCQGESIQDSPAALAQEMRAIVREQLAAGRTPDDVKAYFVDKYGEWILLRPKAQGWNMLVYVLPLVVLLIGAAVIVRATRRWTAPNESKVQHEVEQETAET